jgi:hypothetical protein
MWVNPRTRYPVQIEHKWTDQSRLPVTYSSIQIDAELADDLFSLEPPEGYTLRSSGPNWPAGRKKIMTKAMRLGLWCVVYAGRNDDRFPEKLTDLVTSGIVREGVLKKVLADPDDPGGPPVIRYRKPDDVGKDRANEVILYETGDPRPEGGLIACFADGHCELISDQNRFEELIK